MKSFKQYLNESGDGLFGMPVDYIKTIIFDWVKERIEEYGLDIEPLDLYVHGSRVRGDNRPDSDVDAVLYYKGGLKEDYVFDMFHEDPLMIDGVQVDINPIRDEETGDLASYIERDKAYVKKL